MLEIFLGREHQFPDNGYVRNPEKVIASLDLLKNTYAEKVLREIEEGQPSSKNMFIDRYGRGLYSGVLSTSSKILLIADQTDHTVRADEMGRNAVAFFLQYADKGKLHFTFLPDMPVPTRYPISVNSVVCNSDIDFLNVIEEVE